MTVTIDLPRRFVPPRQKRGTKRVSLAGGSLHDFLEVVQDFGATQAESAGALQFQ